MSDFLTRWSRRKAAAAEPAPAAPPALPPLESLSAESDFTAFLARGVPSAVQAQALRVAWSDPAIADFRGMAEYAWDFNAPDYGALAATDDTAALLSRIVRSVLVAKQDPPAPPVALREPAPRGAPEALPRAPSQAEPAPSLPPIRRHGGALPT